MGCSSKIEAITGKCYVIGLIKRTLIFVSFFLKRVNNSLHLILKPCQSWFKWNVLFHRVAGQFTLICPADVVLLEGILIFYYKDVRQMFDMKLFVDTDADTRLSRRVLRDIEERGRDLEHVLHQYTTLVKPAFEEFCLPVSF